MSLAVKHNKRRKTSTDINITDLPDEAVKYIAGCLPKPSRALLAVALTTESSRWTKIDWTKSVASPSILSLWGKTKRKQPSAATNAIVLPPSQNNIWGNIDFGDIEPCLASRLTDDDIAAVLACVNALHKLKTCVLSGCINISGRGLVPLRGSEVLERLDMSLVGRHENPILKCEPLLSKTQVIPILDSIVDRENHSLKYIQFPKMWRDQLNCERQKTKETFAALVVTYHVKMSCRIMGQECEISMLPKASHATIV